MAEMEEKLGAILSNPQMMQNIMAMAQSLSQDSPSPPQQTGTPEIQLPDIDFSMLQKLGGLGSQTSIDPHQKALLNALTPYLNQSRIQKLERAMRAAKIARLASVFLNSGGLQLLSGR